MNKNVNFQERCDGCGRWVEDCSLVIDGDKCICKRCWALKSNNGENKMKKMTATLEVIHKLKCGQNIFRKPLIEKMVAEVVERVDVDELPPINIDYKSPVLSQDEKIQVEEGAKNLIKKYGYSNTPTILARLCIENVRLIKEINEHRASRGIEPLPTFEV